MPDDKDTKGTEGDTGNDKDKKSDDSQAKAIEFDAFLKEQSQEVQDAYKTHTDGLTSALQKERDANKERAVADKKRDDEAAVKKRDADEAERKRLEEQGEFQKLAEQSTTRADKADARVAELEPLTERVKVLEGAVTGMVETAKKDVPEHILALLEAMPLEKQLEYLAKHGEALRKGGDGPEKTPDKDRDSNKITHEEKLKRSTMPRL